MSHSDNLLAERVQQAQPQSGHQNRDLQWMNILYVQFILGMHNKGHRHGNDLRWSKIKLQEQRGELRAEKTGRCAMEEWSSSW